MRVRVHVPTTAGRLRSAVAGSLSPDGPVFLARQAEDAGGDEREAAEFDALCEAAAGSVALLAADPAESPRRAVAVAVVDPTRLRDSRDGWALDGAIAWADVDAVFLDETDAEPDVIAVLGAVRAGADPTDAQYDAVEERSLLWFAPAEIPAALPTA